MAHWLLKDYRESVDVFLFSFQESLLTEENEIEASDSTVPAAGSGDHFDYPSVFNFYTYLRTHPLLRRRHLSQHRSSGAGGAGALKTPLSRVSSYASQLSEGKQWTGADVYSLQRSLCFHTACIHLNSGLPDIALEV